MDPAPVWTAQEASAALDDVRKHLAEARKVTQEIRDAQAHADDIEIVYGKEVRDDDHVAHREWQRHDSRIRAARSRLQAIHNELSVRGIQLKDVDMGLVDFLAVHGGDRVYLCWREGEPSVQAWHPVDSGFAGRQPLPPDVVRP